MRISILRLGRGGGGSILTGPRTRLPRYDWYPPKQATVIFKSARRRQVHSIRCCPCVSRVLEPTKELDSRNVSGPLTDRRPSCRDLTPKSNLRLTTCGRATKATRNYYWLLPLRSPGPGAAIFATFAFSTSHVEVYSISKIFPPLHIGKSAYW